MRSLALDVDASQILGLNNDEDWGAVAAVPSLEVNAADAALPVSRSFQRPGIIALIAGA